MIYIHVLMPIILLLIICSLSLLQLFSSVKAKRSVIMNILNPKTYTNSGSRRRFVPAAIIIAANLLLFCVTASAAEDILFPLKINDSVSATFCEYRSNHLHAGLDLRTKRRTGIPVMAPSSGRVVSLYGDENGYGLMLTFKADNGLIYKFAHLSAFENENLGLADLVKSSRAGSGRRFNFDIDLSGKNISASAGQVIAYSGDTGAGPPHLHFEITDGGGSGDIMNPLKYLPVESAMDNTPVKIVSAVFMPADENSFIEGKPINQIFNFKAASSAAGGSGFDAFGADLSLNAAGSFRISVRAFDENKIFADNESKTGVYKIQLREITGPPKVSHGRESETSGAKSSPAGRVIYALGFDAAGRGPSRSPDTVYDMHFSNISAGNFYYKMFYEGAPADQPAFVEAVNNGGMIEVREGEVRTFEISASDYLNNVTKKIIRVSGSAEKSKPADLSAAVIGARDAGGEAEQSYGAVKGEGVSAAPPESKAKKGAAKKTAAARKTKTGKAPSKSLKNKTAALESNIPAVEYADNVILFKIKISVKNGSAVITHSGKKLKRFEHDGFYCYYTGYEKFVSMPEITVDMSGASAGVSAAAKKYGLKIYKIAPGNFTEISSGGNYLINIDAAAGKENPVYAGENYLKPVDGAAAVDAGAENVLDISFSSPVPFAKIYRRASAGAVSGGREGLYLLYQKTNIFIGNAVEAVNGGRYFAGQIRKAKRVKCSVMADEKPPVLKISKKSGAKLSKAVKLAAKPDNNFISFNLTDAETGINRANIKYYIDGAESGNFEFFSGWLLNCYLYDIKTVANLKPGEHKIKVTAADNSGNISVYEKQFKVAGK
jgi:hypothetical protein